MSAATSWDRTSPKWSAARLAVSVAIALVFVGAHVAVVCAAPWVLSALVDDD